MRTVLRKLFVRLSSQQSCLDESTLAKCNAALLREVQRLNAQLHNLNKRHAELSRNYSSVLADNFKLRLEVNHARSRSEHAL
jgi:hypothetical protein